MVDTADFEEDASGKCIAIRKLATFVYLQKIKKIICQNIKLLSLDSNFTYIAFCIWNYYPALVVQHNLGI